MGEVYRARDTTLNRDVAIKVLLPAVASDPDRLARLRREAHVLAALNHTNIAEIYGLEEGAGARALVMELVEGPTLAERITTGAIPIDEAVPIARQIAEALASRGIAVLPFQKAQQDVVAIARKLEEEGLIVTGAAAGEPYVT